MKLVMLSTAIVIAVLTVVGAIGSSMVHAVDKIEHCTTYCK